MTVSQKLTAILAALNAISDESDTNITDAVNTIKEYVEELAAEVDGKTSPQASGTKNIYENGTVDVAGYKYANVTVPQQLSWSIENGVLTMNELVEPFMPTGDINITENGTYLVLDKAYAIVAIPDEPTAERTITVNGRYDVRSYGYVVVEIPKPTAERTITKNGRFDVRDYGYVVVNVP